MKGGDYRADIDGLRALAVLPVVLFHADLGFPGGFVGVDVFFVISGFLITSLILRDLRSQRFSLATFWERRIRRILPPLVVVIVASIVLGWFILLPADLKDLAGSVAAQALTAANVWFWRDFGYFDSRSETKPLLHLWSLSVEEQFYIFFPIVMSSLFRRSEKHLIGAIVIGAAASFGLNVYVTAASPDAAYYLLPTRAWELLVGAALCFAPAPGYSWRWLRELAATTGLAAIAIAGLFYHARTPFPGIAALLPCAGAAAVIWGGSGFRGLANAGESNQGLTARLVGCGPLRAIGLISYSLYLWHWPLLAFANYLHQGLPSLSTRVAAVCAAAILAVVSWRIVETPFRDKSIGRERGPLFKLAGGSMAALLTASLLIALTAGGRGRFSEQTLKFADAGGPLPFRHEATVEEVQQHQLPGFGTGNLQGSVRCLLWGDSHAMAIAPVFQQMAEEHDQRCVVATRSSTAPLLNFVSGMSETVATSVQFNHEVLNFIRRARVQEVVLVGRWSGYRFQSPASRLKFFEDTIAAVHQAGARVSIMLQVPEYPFDVPRKLARLSVEGRDITAIRKSLDDHRAQFQAQYDFFSKLADGQIRLIDPAPLLADQTGWCRLEFDGRALYRDRHHLTAEGAAILKPLFGQIFVTTRPEVGTYAGGDEPNRTSVCDFGFRWWPD